METTRKQPGRFDPSEEPEDSDRRDPRPQVWKLDRSPYHPSVEPCTRKGVFRIPALAFPGTTGFIYECCFCRDSFGTRLEIASHLETEHLLLVSVAKLVAEPLVESRGAARNYAFPVWEGTTCTDRVIMEALFSASKDNMTVGKGIEIHYLIVTKQTSAEAKSCSYCCKCGLEFQGHPTVENLIGIRAHYFFQHMDLDYVTKKTNRVDYARDWIIRKERMNQLRRPGIEARHRAEKWYL